MSEYWKSTPKSWCKYCKTFVKDTPFEKKQHDATPRHQGNVQRSLRTLHKEHDREARDKQRAQDEVARLNGIVAGKSSSSGTRAGASSQPKSGAGLARAPPPPRQADAEERKKQAAQLAQLGVAIPEEFRKELAVAGDWQTVSVKQVESMHAPAPDAEDVKGEARSFGVRKRKLEEGEDALDEPDAQTVSYSSSKLGWGSRMKSYEAAEDKDVDFAALLGKKARDEEDSGDGSTQHIGAATDAEDLEIKKEEEEDKKPDLNAAKAQAESEPPVPMFKKRKSKVAR